MEYQSTVEMVSEAMPGVRYRIARMSFGRRLELTRRVRELTGRLRYLEAGDQIDERAEAAVLANEIEKLYLEWGLREIHGLVIDGQAATTALLVEAGPEALCREISAAIRRECGLSEEERKN